MGADYSKECRGVAFCCLLLMAPVAAQGEESGPYLKIEGGHSWTQQAHWHLGGDTGESTVWGAGLGYRISDNFRADVSYANRSGFEIGGRDGSYDVSGNVTNKTAMLSLYWDIGTFSSFTPYVGAGVGWALNKTQTAYYVSPSSSGSRDGAADHNFAWQAMAGVSYAITPAISIDFSTRFLDAGQVHLDRTGEVLGVSGSFNNPVWGRLRIFEGLTALRYQF